MSYEEILIGAAGGIISLVSFLAGYLYKAPPKPTDSAADIYCPVCGYYCLGEGGFGCVDKLTQYKREQMALHKEKGDE